MSEQTNQDMGRIIDRIRKMLAMANDKANIHESSVAAAMAEKLMRKYQLDMSDVLVQELSARDVNAEYEWTGGKAKPWQEWIAVAVAQVNDCEVRYTNVRDKNSMGLEFIGVGPDPTVAAEIYKYLYFEVRRLAKIHVKGRANINSFYKGAADTLCHRLKAQAQERATEFLAKATGTALVIHKKQLIEEVYGPFAYGQSGAKTRYDQAWAAGARAARDISLNDQVGADTRGALE